MEGKYCIYIFFLEVISREETVNSGPGLFGTVSQYKPKERGTESICYLILKSR